MNCLNAKRELIPIFFATDDNYSSYLSVALRSIIEHSNKDNDYEIFILVEDISAENSQRILSMATPNVKISFVSVTDQVCRICNSLHIRDYYTRTTYYRFFIPELFPVFSKGLYLDCDLVITTDVSELYHTELGNNYIAAAPEEFITDVDVFGIYSEKVLCVPRENYINAGVLVMNLDLMRADRINERFATLLSAKTYRVAQDQDYLNVLCKDRTVILDKTWNKTPMPKVNRSINPKIAHYKINFKPWKFENVAFGELFWHYAESSPYYDALLLNRDQYTDEERIRDKKQYESLVRLALSEINEKDREQEIFNDAMLYAVE